MSRALVEKVTNDITLRASELLASFSLLSVTFVAFLFLTVQVSFFCLQNPMTMKISPSGY